MYRRQTDDQLAGGGVNFSFPSFKQKHMVFSELWACVVLKPLKHRVTPESTKQAAGSFQCLEWLEQFLQRKHEEEFWMGTQSQRKLLYIVFMFGKWV